MCIYIYMYIIKHIWVCIYRSLYDLFISVWKCSRVISILLFHFQTLLCRRLSNGHLSSKYRLFLLNNSPMEEFQSGCCTAVSDQCCSDLHHAMTRTEIEICKLCLGTHAVPFFTPLSCCQWSSQACGSARSLSFLSCSMGGASSSKKSPADEAIRTLKEFIFFVSYVGGNVFFRQDAHPGIQEVLSYVVIMV